MKNDKCRIRNMGALGLGVVAAVALLAVTVEAETAGEQGRELQRPLEQNEVSALAAEVDRLVNEGLREAGVRPTRRLTDDQFARRVYLDIVGRVPTYDELMAFRRQAGSTRRARLIDQLLESEGHVSHKFNYWADILRVTSDLNGASGQPYIDFVKDAIRENRPYDEFVFDLLTAEGRLHENGAVGYYIRDDGMPLDNTANTVQIFLGTSIGCAQCHDHPFDQWSQIEFFEMAAYTFGVRTRDGIPNLEQAYRDAREADETPREIVRALDRLRRSYRFRVHDQDSTIRLPHDYKYADAQPGDAVEPFTIFGDVPEPGPNLSEREAYARWVTSSSNERFSRVIANRLWKRAFGVGVIEPVDEVGRAAEPFNDALIDHLQQLMVDLEFDLREFQRVIYNTQAYQRRASREQWEPGEAYHFAGPLLRRMTAEQVWDSFVTLAVGPQADQPLEGSAQGYGGSGDDWRAELTEMSVEEIRELAERLVQSGQGMMMMGGGGGASGMVRASYLPSPAPPGHFLWRFGQSDRNLIDNATRDPSTTQVLTLLNGPIDEILLADHSYLAEKVAGAGSNADALSVIWLSILGRAPEAGERRLAMQEIGQQGDVAFDNLVWALLNTREFLFIQ